MTMRRRLLVGLLGVLVVLIAGVGTAEVVVLRHVLYQRSAQALRTELQLLAASGPGPSTPPTTPAGTDPASCSALGAVTEPGPKGPGPNGTGPGKGRTLGPGGAGVLAQVLAQRGIASAVVGPEGSVLACAPAAQTGRQTSFTVPLVAARELSAGATGYATLHTGGHHLLVIAQPVGADTAILVSDLGDDDAAVGTVLLITVIGGLAALVVAGLLSRPLLRTGLAPLRKVARTADAIAAGDLDQRADLAGSPDEVGRLGAAFDAMVDRLQLSLSERDQLVDQLGAREQTMRRFLADASHELRTPLTAIRGGAQVLLLGSASDPTELAESLGHIHDQSERMSRLVADLLLLSRQEGAGPGFVREPVDLGALVSDERVHWDAISAGHPLTVDTEPAWVDGERDALVRLCANLVDNAAKYSSPGSSIDVTVHPVGGRAELVVADHGPGIAVTDRARVFERFYRGDPARSRTTGGSGLGLAIVASIAADHDGHARADETPGGGARLVVTVPLTQRPHPGRAGTHGHRPPLRPIPAQPNESFYQEGTR